MENHFTKISLTENTAKRLEEAKRLVESLSNETDPAIVNEIKKFKTNINNIEKDQIEKKLPPEIFYNMSISNLYGALRKIGIKNI